MMVSFVVAGLRLRRRRALLFRACLDGPGLGLRLHLLLCRDGRALAWMVGWALILEYAVGASAVAVGWSGYFVGLLEQLGAVPQLSGGARGLGPEPGRLYQPARGRDLAVLVTGAADHRHRRKARASPPRSCRSRSSALTLFVDLTFPVLNGAPISSRSFPMAGAPTAWSARRRSIFFAYVGFDAVSTAAEETVNPQRNVPIGLIGCSADLHRLLSSGLCRRIGAMGAEPVRDAAGHVLAPGSPACVACVARRRRHDRAAGLLEGSARPCASRGRLQRVGDFMGSPRSSRFPRSC